MTTISMPYEAAVVGPWVITRCPDGRWEYLLESLIVDHEVLGYRAVPSVEAATLYPSTREASRALAQAVADGVARDWKIKPVQEVPS